jgi:hypothetical protein
MTGSGGTRLAPTQPGGTRHAGHGWVARRHPRPVTQNRPHW